MNDGQRVRRAGWVVLGVFVVIALAVAGSLAVDRRPPEWDHANHLERAVACADDLGRGDFRSLLERSSFYPPLVPCAAAVVYRVVPSDVAGAQAVIVAFLGLGMAATFLLGRRFAGDAGGAVAAVVFGAAPFTVWQALRFQLDLPLASMVAMALEMLLRTDAFRHRGWSVAAGVVFGLGMLAKPPFAAYVLPPTLLVLGRVRGRAIGHAALAAAAAIVVALPWYGSRALGFAHQISVRSFRQAAEQGHPEPMTAAALTYYPLNFPAQFGVVAVALFVVGFAVALRRRLGFPLLALLPLAVFFVIQNKNLRYTEPLLAAAAVVAGVGYAALPRAARVVAAGTLVIATAVQISAATFGVPSQPRLAVAGVPLVMESPPMRVDWRHREILAALARDSGGRPATVSVVPNHAFFSIANFRYYGVRDRRPFAFVRAWDGDPLGVEYMILKTGDVGPAFTAEKPHRIAERLAGDRNFARMFPVIGEWSLPDGSVATLRARRRVADLDATPVALARAIETAFLRRLPDVARDVSGLGVRLEYDHEILTGRLTRVEITAAAATVAEFTRRRAARVRLHDVRIVLDDVLVNPFSAWLDQRLVALDVGRMRLERLTIRADDLQAFLGELRGFRDTTVALGDGWLTLVKRQPGPDVAARLRVVPADDRPFGLAADSLTLGGVPVPRLLADWVLKSYDPSRGLAQRTAMPVEIGPVTVTPDAIAIAATPR